MKRILGIISVVLGCIALFAFFVLSCVAKGLTLGNAILAVLISIVATLVIISWVYLTLWLLD